MTDIVESRYLKVLTVTGAFLILLPVGVSWYWGNISVYILSYILYCTALDRGLEAPWILSLMRATWTLGLLSSGYFTKLTGKRHATVTLGVFIFNGGIFLSYFSTKISVVMTSVCIGALVGFGKGLLEVTTLNFVIDLSFRDAWFLKSFVLCAVPTGAIIISQFATLLVNPFNLSPNLKAGHMMFFSQKEVLENVPSMFVKLGIASLAVQIIGILMLGETDRDIQEDNERSNNYGSVTPPQITPTFSSVKNSDGSDEFNDSSSSGSRGSYADKGQSYDNETNAKDQATLRSEALSKTTENSPLNESLQSATTAIHRDASLSCIQDYKSSDFLKSCAFFAITISYLCGDTSFIVFKNYYKSYGQQSIQDDHFLAEAVIVLSLIAIFVKIIWIFIMDGIGHITCMICQCALMTVLTIFVYLSPFLNKWMYLFLYSVFNAVACSYDEVFTAISFKQFGKDIFNSNCGLVTAFTIGVHLLTAPILQTLLNNLGWFSIFAYSASLNFAGMIMLIAFCLKTSKCWKFQNGS